MTVSLVGRMAMGRSRSLDPAFVTHATCTHTLGSIKELMPSLNIDTLQQVPLLQPPARTDRGAMAGNTQC